MRPRMASATPAERASAPEPPPAKGALPAALLLALLLGCFALFAGTGVPHLTNNAVGDLEFTGWSGPIAEHLLRGERPYLDFVLPIPPGSFALLALVQKLAGRPLLLQELWLNQICNLSMALAAYAIARPFTSRLNAILIAFSSLVTLLRVPKECAYDHTALLMAWLSVAFGAHALVLEPGRRRNAAWVGAGVAAGLTFAFKQSTAAGIVAGWLGAALYLVAVALAARDPERLRAEARDFSRWAAGLAIGLALLWLLLHALGTSIGAYYRAVFTDGAPLKGGSLSLAATFVGYLLGSPAYLGSLLPTLAVAAVLVRLTRQPAGLHLGEQPVRAELDFRSAAAVAVPSLLAFGGATVLIARRVPALPDWVAFWADRLRYLPASGLLFGSVFFVSQRAPRRDRTITKEARRRGHELNALTLLALSVTLLHNLSSPEFRPFYDNNPIIPFAFLFLFEAFERAVLPRLKYLVFLLALAALFSPKLDRMLAAHFPTGRLGQWSGLYVNDSAVPVVRAAQRVWELTSDDDRVLVLPEDLEIVGLIGRPRPALEGAVLFVDQYPRRLLAHDLAELQRNPPKVVVIRPGERELWQRVFAIWTSRSAAAAVTERFLDDWLPKRYLLDSARPTRFGDRTAELQIWVRKD